MKNIFLNPHQKNSDERGFFTEIARAKTQGQFSYSITNSGFTRGNHFHTRKIERFSVIEGSALIELRKIGDNKIYSFVLSGENPSLLTCQFGIPITLKIFQTILLQLFFGLMNHIMKKIQIHFMKMFNFVKDVC